jgi:hypothetical protein
MANHEKSISCLYQSFLYIIDTFGSEIYNLNASLNKLLKACNQIRNQY